MSFISLKCQCRKWSFFSGKQKNFKPLGRQSNNTGLNGINSAELATSHLGLYQRFVLSNVDSSVNFPRLQIYQNIWDIWKCCSHLTQAFYGRISRFRRKSTIALVNKIFYILFDSLSATWTLWARSRKLPAACGLLAIKGGLLQLC